MPVMLEKGEIIFDRFEIEDIKNWSGQAICYTAQDLKCPPKEPWNKRVFVKQFHDALPGTAEAERIPLHYKALEDRLGDNKAYLNLPIWCGEANGSITLIFPYVRASVNLRSWMESGKLTEDQCVRFAISICDAVRILHKQNIAHLDLKPENILLDQNRKTGKWYVHLIDLDSSKIDGKGLRDRVIGTPYYMSPEHMNPERFGDVSVKSDVFTLGIMLFELLLKSHPYGSESDYKNAVLDRKFWVPANPYHKEVIGKIIQSLRLRPGQRPRSGWIHSTLYNHQSNDFRAIDMESSWRSKVGPIEPEEIEASFSPIAIKISSNRVPEFSRVYYDDVIITRNELRGLFSSHANNFMFTIFKKDDEWMVENRAKDAFNVGGISLQGGKGVPLSDKIEILVGGEELILEPIFDGDELEISAESDPISGYAQPDKESSLFDIIKSVFR